MSRTTMRHLFVAVLTLTSLTSVACHNESSTFSNTREMRASFLAVADGSGTTFVSARLSVEDIDMEGRIPVKLNSRDRLRATSIDATTGATDEQIMVEHGLGRVLHYDASFPTEENGTRIEIALERDEKGEASAPNSHVILPTPFQLDWVDDPVALTPAPVNFSRSSSTPLFVVWDPFDTPDFERGDELSFRVSGPCHLNISGVIDWENGEDVLELTGGVLGEQLPPNDGSCLTQVEFTLQREGTIDRRYESGAFSAEQVRVLELQSMP